MHSRYHADSAYVSYVGVDHNGVEFIGNKFTHSHTELYVLVQIMGDILEML